MNYHPKSDFMRVMFERGFVADCTDYQALDEALVKDVLPGYIGFDQGGLLTDAVIKHPHAVLLLDEPTAVLTPGEAARLLSTLRALLDESSEPDRALLIVTHKLDEVLQVADRAVVMRQGRIVEEFQRSEFSAQAMARAMVGREVFSLRRPSSDLRTEQPVRAVPLRVRDLVVSRAGVDWVRGVSLDVPSGQIVGIDRKAGIGIEAIGQVAIRRTRCRTVNILGIGQD